MPRMPRTSTFLRPQKRSFCVECISDIQRATREIRKAIGEIQILASEQWLLDEAGGNVDNEEEKEKPKEGGGCRPKVLADRTYATESAYTSTSAARLEAVKSAAKPPLRSTSDAFLKVRCLKFLICIGQL